MSSSSCACSCRQHSTALSQIESFTSLHTGVHESVRQKAAKWRALEKAQNLQRVAMQVNSAFSPQSKASASTQVQHVALDVNRATRQYSRHEPRRGPKRVISSKVHEWDVCSFDRKGVYVNVTGNTLRRHMRTKNIYCSG